MGHTENKILQAKVWQKPNTCQLNYGSQTLAWQNVDGNQTPPKNHAIVHHRLETNGSTILLIKLVIALK
jgi:hypothetical protein